jgi:quinol-cytochrome oxidoreductase complex cytochrome b subunit
MSDTQLSETETIPFYPDHVRTEFKVVIGVMVLVGIVATIGLFSPVGLEEPADPMVTPDHVKPEWYFLALYQLLKYIPKTIGALVPMLLLGAVILWPFFDRKPETSKKVQKIRLISVSVGMIVLILLTIWGQVS